MTGAGGEPDHAVVGRGTPPTARTRVRRLPERGVYDRGDIDAILDEALICHLAWVTDEGFPRVIPTIHARHGDTLYVHGSTASRTLLGIADGREVSVAATILDGLVFARSAFHHSMNYRSVVLYGRPREVTDPEEKAVAQRAIVEHIARGRAADARLANRRELDQTTFLAVPIEEASAKVRTGPPKDDEDDLGLPVWAGVLPLRLVPGEPEPAPELGRDVRTPGYVAAYRRPTRPRPGPV
jgi:nitroimidazol reductase NimA-like FMN-containing flavoprotein (pyridoxamine 5'-phosphate oxidase superfamily)